MPITPPPAPPMHIMVVIQDFTLGGAKRIAIRLAGAWRQQGCRVTLVAGSGDGPLRTMVPDGMTPVVPETPLTRSLTRWPLARHVLRQCRADPPDLLFLPGNYYFEIAAVVKLAMRRPPAIVGKISNVVIRRREKWRRAILRITALKWKARFLDRIVVMMPAFLDETRRVLGGGQVRYVTIPQPALDNAPDRVPRPVSMPDPAGEQPRATTLITAGRLMKQKNFPSLLAALTLLPDAVDLTILGEGPLRDELVALARTLGVAHRVRFAGYAPDVIPHFRLARLFVLPSDYEGFPSVIIEAFAAGLPVVATDCSPAIRPLISDDQVGRVVPLNDPTRLSRAISDMLARPQPDPSLLEPLARPYTLPASAARYIALFHELCRERGGPGDTLPIPRFRQPGKRVNRG
ncbi:MAG: glycosyltransferase [Sphingobium sp.]